MSDKLPNKEDIKVKTFENVNDSTLNEFIQQHVNELVDIKDFSMTTLRYGYKDYVNITRVIYK